MKKALVNSKTVNGPAFDSLLLAFIQIITYATNIATTKILSVQLSLTEYGTYATVNSVITIAASFTLFGLGDAINYFYNRKSQKISMNERTEYVNSVFFVQLIVGVIVGVVLLVFSQTISNYYSNPMVKPLIVIACIKPWISNATHLYQVLFVSSGKSKLIAIRNLIISVSKVFLLYISVIVFKSLSSVFFCLVALDIAQLIAFRYIFGKTKFKIRVFSFKKEKIIPVIKYCVPMGVFFVTTTIMRETDKLVIGRLGTTEDYAIYANCAKQLPVNILVVSFATVLIPYIMKSVSGKNFQATIVILQKYLTVGYMSVWMFSGALLLCAPEAIQFFYSNEYLPGVPVFVIYVIEGMVQFAGFHLVIAANGDSKFLMYTSLTLLILNVILSFGLYYAFGLFGFAMIGPAIATLLVSILYISVFCLKTSRIIGMKIRTFLPVKSMLLYLCELVLVGAVFLLLKYGLEAVRLHWVIILLSICAFYCLAIAVLNIRKYKMLFSEINRLKQSEL